MTSHVVCLVTGFQFLMNKLYECQTEKMIRNDLQQKNKQHAVQQQSARIKDVCKAAKILYLR